MLPRAPLFSQLPWAPFRAGSLWGPARSGRRREEGTDVFLTYIIGGRGCSFWSNKELKQTVVREDTQDPRCAGPA